MPNCISINLSVNFVEFKRFKDTDVKSQNSRIYDLLDHYDLLQRLYSDNVPLPGLNIDYSRIQEKLSLDRKISSDFLINAIEN